MAPYSSLAAGIRRCDRSHLPLVLARARPICADDNGQLGTRRSGVLAFLPPARAYPLLWLERLHRAVLVSRQASWRTGDRPVARWRECGYRPPARCCRGRRRRRYAEVGRECRKGRAGRCGPSRSAWTQRTAVAAERRAGTIVGFSASSGWASRLWRRTRRGAGRKRQD